VRLNSAHYSTLEIGEGERGERRELTEVHGNGFGDPLFFHRNAIKDVSKRHGFLVMGDDDELGPGRHFLEHFLEANDVRLVERGIHLVEKAEGVMEVIRYRYSLTLHKL